MIILAAREVSFDEEWKQRKVNTNASWLGLFRLPVLIRKTGERTIMILVQNAG